MSDAPKRPLTLEEILAKANVKVVSTSTGFVAKEQSKNEQPPQEER